MIKSILLHNFQSWKIGAFILHPGVNAFIGSSGAGKTAILRGVELVVNNKPVGNSFMSHWGGDTKVEIIVDEGLVRRVRGKTKNQYWVDEEELKAFGVTVPDPVIKLLNMKPLNIQYQMDSPFMLSNTPGEIARYLNQVTNLDLIDVAQTNIAKIVKDNKQDLSHLEGRKGELEEELKEYAVIDDMEVEVARLEKLEKKSDMVLFEVTDLDMKIEAVEEIEANLARTRTLIKAEPEIRDLLGILDKGITLKDEINEMLGLIRTVEALESTLAINKALLKADTRLKGLITKNESYEVVCEEVTNIGYLISQVEDLGQRATAAKKLAEAETQVLRLGVLHKKYAILCQESDDLTERIDRIETTESVLNTTSKELVSMEKDLKDNYPDICPFCNSVISKSKKGVEPCH